MGVSDLINAQSSSCTTSPAYRWEVLGCELNRLNTCIDRYKLYFVLPGLCSTILLAVSVYLLIVSELLPEKSDTLPLIGVYFIITMLEISLVLVATIFVLKAYHATSRPPRFLQIFALRFKKLQEYKVFKVLILQSSLFWSACYYGYHRLVLLL